MEELDWDDLRYFLRAVRAGTLAGAARAMHVQHTTIGRRLSSLERAFGAPLVLRGPEGLTLTPLGERVGPLVEHVERAVEAVRDMVASQRSRVRLAVPSGFTRLFTPGLAKLARDNPSLSLELLSGARSVDLKKGEADLALRIGPVADRELVVKKLGESGWALYAAHEYLRKRPRVDPDELSGHDVIGYDHSLASMPAAQWLESRAAKANVVVRSREMTDMLAAALSGAGLAVLPCLFADTETGLKRLTRETVASRAVSLVYRRETRHSASVRAVIRFVTDVLHDQLS